MDSSGIHIPFLVIAVGLVLVAASLAVYIKIIRLVAVRGGKVPTDKFGPADLIAAGALLVLFLWGIYSGFHAKRPDIHGRDIIAGQMINMIIVTMVASFMFFRGINLYEQLGFAKVRFSLALWLAVILLIAAYPLVLCVSAISQTALGDHAEPQELVQFFSKAAQDGNYKLLLVVLATGVVFAPVTEEFIFRGYIYPVLKRYTGIVPAILINAVIFAAIHLNETSLPSLFLLAACFTIVYEFTGSILVNMIMHSVFNLFNLGMLFMASHFSKA